MAEVDFTQNGAEAQFGESQEGKIFVGGLSWETTVKDLKDYFSKFGEVVDTTLKTDPTTGRSRGFGFVLFSDPSSVEKVIHHDEPHKLHGRDIDPKRAKPRGGREPILKVFVGGLDPSIPESDIKEYFEQQFGKVRDIDLPFDKTKNQRRAFCFVTFESETVVDSVCEEAKQSIAGKPVDIKKATPKDQQGGYGYGGRGGFGGRGGRGRGRDYSGYGQWGNYDYGQSGYGYGYDQNYGSYGNYDYNNYYNQGGYGQGGYQGYYGNQGYGGYGGYDQDE